MKNWLISLLLLAGLAWMNGCDQDPALSPEEQEAVDVALIEQYVADNNLDGYYTENNIFVSLDEEGTGTETPGPNSTVEVVYTGKYLTGNEFDSSDGLSVQFGLQQVIAGWREGLQEFKRGARGIIIIPSRYAYGPRGRASIPPNSVLLFELELLDFQ